MKSSDSPHRSPLSEVKHLTPQDLNFSARDEALAIFASVIEDLRMERDKVLDENARLREALSAVDNIAYRMEQAATPHGATGQQVRSYSRWAAEIQEALYTARLA